jgi:hypothetical protein
MPESHPNTTYCGSPQQATTPVMPKSESSSNVDLLAGLDFTVSQPPLQPQPKVESAPAPLPQQQVPSPTKVSSSLTILTISFVIIYSGLKQAAIVII